MKIVIISVLLSVIAGFGGGWMYQATMGTNNTNTSKSTVSSEGSALIDTKTLTLAECLTDVWGADKYAAISANSSLATTDDNLASLKCYN